MLSILIPTHNDACLNLVEGLHAQCEALAQQGLRYEIVVADDGSTDEGVKAANRQVGLIPHCRYLEKGRNVGRARIRNYLVEKSFGSWLLFIDSDLGLCSDAYVEHYFRLMQTADHPVVYGGTRISGDPVALKGNLRYRYEKRAEPLHQAQQRNLRPQQELSVCNCLVSRSVAEAHPFDARFRLYGYEDVLFGKRLAESGIPIFHTDNPVLFSRFESNASFLSKTEEAVRTLCQFHADLEGFSNLEKAAQRIARCCPPLLFRLFHRIFGPLERRNLCGNRPSLLLLKLYKLGLYFTLRR